MDVLPGKLDIVLASLKKISDYSNSDKEPLCQSFRVCVGDNKIMIFEKCAP